MPAVKVMGWLLVDSVETHISEVATYFLTGIFDQLIGLHISFRPLAGNVRMLSVFLYQLSIKREEEGNNGSGSRQHLPRQKDDRGGPPPAAYKTEDLRPEHILSAVRETGCGTCSCGLFH